MNEDGSMDFFIFPEDMSEEDRKALVKRIRDQRQDNAPAPAGAGQ